MLIEAIYLAETQNNTEEVNRLCCRFAAIRMDATDYTGEYIRPKDTDILAHGQGKRVKDGDTHEGEFEDGELKKTGNIKITYSSGERFEGYWEEEKKIRGTYWYSNGSEFTGEWNNEQRNGHGVLKYRDQRVYEGEFEEDNIKGQGTLTNPLGGGYAWFDLNAPPGHCYKATYGGTQDYEDRKGEWLFDNDYV